MQCISVPLFIRIKSAWVELLWIIKVLCHSTHD